MGTKDKNKAAGGFSVGAGQLKDALERVKHVVPTETAHEVFRHVLLHQRGHDLRLVACDSETHIVFFTQVDPFGGRNDWINMAVLYDQLTHFLKHIPDEIMIECVQIKDENGTPCLLIESSYGQQTFLGMDASQYPPFPEVPSHYSIMLDSGLFLGAISHLAFAAGEVDMFSEKAIYFDFLPDCTNLIATDGRILSLYSFQNAILGDTKSGLVPVKTLHTFISSMRGLPCHLHVHISISESHILLSHAGLFLSSRLLNGSFPDYRCVIPSKTPYTAIFEQAKLREAVKRLLAFPNKGMLQMALRFEKDNATLYGGSAVENVPCKYDGGTFNISLSGEALLSILDNIKRYLIVMRMAGNGLPVIIEPVHQGYRTRELYLIMPVAIRNGRRRTK